MKYLYLIIMFYIAIFAVSCNKDSEHKQIITDSANTSQNYNQINSAVSDNKNIASKVNDRINTDYNTAVIALNLPGSPIDPKKLKDIIPDKIPGAESAPISTGTMMGDDDKLFTTASCNYTMNKGGLVINIQDYGKYENLTSQDKMYFAKMPTESGYETETVVTTEGKGFILWDSEKRNGRMFFLLANRFILKIEAYTLPIKAGDIIFYFNMINQKAILKLATEK